MVAAQCFSIFYTFSTFRTQPFIFQNIAFWSLSFVFQKSHDISAFPDYDTALSVRDRLDGPGFGVFGKSGNSNLQNSRVEAKVLFITCLYLLNPCDISAYTCLVEAVGVFWRAEWKMNLISRLWNTIPGKFSENASTNATNTVRFIAPQGFDLVGATKAFSPCLYLRRARLIFQNIRVWSQIPEWF